MSDYIVIGGGFAGLSAAVHLASRGKKVELIEASQKLGGRAYSFTDKSTGTVIDNGQHIMMGCYYDTIDFLKKIKTADNLDFQKSLEINFVKAGGNSYKLKCPKRFYPFNLLRGILNYKAVSLKDRFKIVDFFLDCVD